MLNPDDLTLRKGAVSVDLYCGDRVIARDLLDTAAAEDAVFDALVSAGMTRGPASTAARRRVRDEEARLTALYPPPAE
jgi:hypothetical protein